MSFAVTMSLWGGFCCVVITHIQVRSLRCKPHVLWSHFLMALYLKIRDFAKYSPLSLIFSDCGVDGDAP